MGKGIGTCEISKIFRKHRSSGGINWIQAEKKKKVTFRDTWKEFL